MRENRPNLRSDKRGKGNIIPESGSHGAYDELATSKKILFDSNLLSQVFHNQTKVSNNCEIKLRG